MVVVVMSWTKDGQLEWYREINLSSLIGMKGFVFGGGYLFYNLRSLDLTGSLAGSKVGFSF